MCQVLGLFNRCQHASDAARPTLGTSRFALGTLSSEIYCAYMYVPGGTGSIVRTSSLPSLNCSSDVPTLYVFPMEKHELDLVTSTCTMS
jgi:hypothetical protein